MKCDKAAAMASDAKHARDVELSERQTKTALWVAFTSTPLCDDLVESGGES